MLIRTATRTKAITIKGYCNNGIIDTGYKSYTLYHKIPNGNYFLELYPINS